MRVRTANKRARLKHRIQVEQESALFHYERTRRLISAGRGDVLLQSAFLRRQKRKNKARKFALYAVVYGMSPAKLGRAYHRSMVSDHLEASRARSNTRQHHG